MSRKIVFKLWIISFILMCACFIGYIGTSLIQTKLPLNNVVKIVCKTDNYDPYYGGGWQGSGVFLSDNVILTAGHIVDGICDANITTTDGRVYKAKQWYLEPTVDIGFIVVDTPERESTLLFANAKLGEEVWAYGSPFGVFPILTKGIISAIDMPDDFSGTKDMIITDAAINGGNSGCPLFNKHGRIVGICSWGYRNAQGMSYFVRADVIKLVLKKHYAVKMLEGVK